MPEETLASDSATSQTSTDSSASSDTSSVGSVTADTQSTATTSADTSTATDSVRADTQIADNAQAANPAGVETKNETAQPEIDYKARFAGAQKSWQQERADRERFQQQADQFQRELQALKQQFQGIQPQEVEQYRQTRELPVWDERSPNHQNFLNLRRLYDHYEQDMRAAPNDEIRQWLSQQMGQALGPEGAKTLRSWREYVRTQEWERQTDPAAYYRKLIQKEAQPVIQQSLQNVSQTYQSVQSAQAEVQKWMKENAEVATPDNIKAVIGMMEKGENFAMAAARVERDHYRSKVSAAAKASASAEEKERLLQGNAAGPIARNPNTAKKVDPKAVAKERGIEVGKGDPRFIQLLQELDQQGLL